MDSTMLQSLLTLVAGVGIIGLMFYFLKKYTLKAQNTSGKLNLKIVSKLHLQPKSSLFVIEAGEKTLLIGVSEKNVSLITDLSDENQKIISQSEEIRKNLPAKTYQENTNLPESLSFKNFLKSAINKQ
jgi:flagellar biogenesis protein FliO